MGNIDWLPIAELPEAFKDGREMLVYGPDGFDFARWHRDHLCGERAGNAPYTHFAEINPPA